MRVNRRNRRATALAIAALRREERFESIDEGLAGFARSTADLFDESIASDQKLYAICAAGRLHLSATLALLHRFPVEVPEADDGTSELLALLQSPAMLGEAREDGDYTNGSYPPWDPRRQSNP